MRGKTNTFILISVFTLAISSCSFIPVSGRLGQLSVQDAWIRPANAGGNGAVYFVIDNATSHDEELLGASTEVAGAAELHQSKMDSDGVMSMIPMDTVLIPAGQNVDFMPGGLHLMLVSLKEDLAVGDSIQVALQFKVAGKVIVDAPVKEQQ
jgi:copper(I)-binding protein